MKKIICFIVLIAAIVFAADVAISGDAVIFNPGDVRTVSFGGDGVAYDTIFTTESNIYGPYRLSTSKNSPMYSGFQAYYMDSTMTAGDSSQISYQIAPGDAITDTINTWNIYDTIVGATEAAGPYTSISSRAGGSIFFKVKNIDTDTAIIQYPIRLYLKESATVNYKR